MNAAYSVFSLGSYLQEVLEADRFHAAAGGA